MKIAFFVLVFLLISIPVKAQDRNIADEKFWVTSTLLIGSTIYDVESTYFALGKCGICREANPVMRPFVEAGRPWLYTIQGSVDAGIIFTSYEMKKRHNKWWWVLPVAVSAAHLTAGTRNIKVAISF